LSGNHRFNIAKPEGRNIASPGQKPRVQMIYHASRGGAAQILHRNAHIFDKPQASKQKGGRAGRLSKQDF